MKEPLYEELEAHRPICPWCGTIDLDGTFDANNDHFHMTCDVCHEEYEAYISVKYTTYPIESKEN